MYIHTLILSLIPWFLTWETGYLTLSVYLCTYMYEYEGIKQLITPVHKH